MDAVTAHVIRADARCLPLPDESVDLIVTSPPYYALRSYQDADEHYAGQLGDEPTPAEYLDALIDCTRDWIRVLKPSGSIWVNLGDKYGRRQNTNVPQTKHGPQAAAGGIAYPSRVEPSDTPKSLLGIPWRYANRCVDELRLTLRAEVIWGKPNGLPESVTDRVRRSHEQWFHFVRDPFGYYSALDAIREPYAPATASRYALGYGTRAIDKHRPTVNTKLGDQRYDENPLGKLPGSVWEVQSEPLIVPKISPLDGRPLPDHFAAFPTEWPRRVIAGWAPASATVLDPFGGTGTTALVADVLGRVGISVDRSHDYCRLARWRTTDPGERARAMRVDKPPVQVPDQAALW